MMNMEKSKYFYPPRNIKYPITQKVCPFFGAREPLQFKDSPGKVLRFYTDFQIYAGRAAAPLSLSVFYSQVCQQTG